MRNIARIWGLMAVVALFGGCPSGTEGELDGQATTIRGRAPLNAGGKFRVIDSAGKEFKGDVAANGSFEAKMGWAEGQFVVEATGGSYIEPANGVTADNSGQTLRAVVTRLNAFKEADVGVTPWTEIAYARGGVEGYADSLKALTEMLSCQGTIFADVLTVPPALPSAGIHSLSNASALSYLYLGAFSHLAHDLSEEIGLEQGRLNSMRLAAILAEDFSDGRIDGQNKGVNLYLVRGHALPPDVLRQRLAQAARHFLMVSPSSAKDWGNLSSIGEDAMGDLLRCISDNKISELGPEGELLDVSGPELEFIMPEEGAYLASEQDVICEAKDKSGIASLDVVFERDLAPQPHARGTPKIVGDNTTVRRFVAPLHFESVATGEIVARCTATDRWGNSSSLPLTLHVNRGGIAPELKTKPEDPNLAGLVEITCDCREDLYSTRCELLSLEGVPGIQLSPDSGPRWAKYTWDTTSDLDGDKTVRCGNTTHGYARPFTKAKSFLVKNHADGMARGAVFLDTFVKGMEVQAIAFKDAIEGIVLGSGEVNSEGVFEFPLSTLYAGPVLFRATYSRSPTQIAEFYNVPLGKMMSCTNASLTLLIEHYEPGQPLKGLSINVASSMHEALAVAKFRLGQYSTFYEAVQDTGVLVTNYLSGSGTSIDPRRTMVMDLSKPVSRAANDQMIMGLFHVGLSRLAIDYSLEYGQGSEQAITISEIVAAMRDDLTDGKLDGKARGAQVDMPHNAKMGEDFFRIELARAIRRWLDETPHKHGQKAASNGSGLTKEAVTSQSPILQNFAAHHSPLFDNRPGEHYNGDGPTIEWRAYGPGKQEAFELRGAVLGSTSFRLTVDAKSESGISKLTVTHNRVELVNQSQSTEVGHGEYVIDTSNLDGPQQIGIEAKDIQGNPPTTGSIGFVVDRVLPTVKLGADELWIRDGDTYQLTGTVAKPHVTAEVFVDDVSVGPVHLSGTEFALPVSLTCDATHRMRLEVRDGAGNSDRAQQTVHCDSKAPTISHLSSPYTQEASRAVIELTHREQPDPDAIKLMNREQATELEKRWDRLDNGDGHDLPTLNFLISDVDGYSIGTAPNKLRVSYKYVFRGGGVTREREWTPLECSRDGACKLIMSYQTMLPEDILRQPVNIARRQNFMAFSSVEDLHSVLIRVEDLAGNVTVAEWTTRLKLYTPPVAVTCSYSSVLKEVRLAHGQLATVPRAAAPNFTAMDIELSTVRVESGESLTPTDGVHVFSFPEAHMEWRIDRVTQQIASLGRYEGAIPNYHSCKGGRDYKQLFDDGECLFVGPRVVPKQWTWTRQANFRDLVLSQGVRPAHHTAEVGVDGSMLRNGVITADVPRKFDGSAFVWASAAPIQGHQETQYSYRQGYDYGGDGKNNLRIDERRFVEDLHISRGEYKPDRISSSPGTPPPISIDYAPSCTNHSTLSWRFNREPLLHEGSALAVEDVTSFYGAEP